MPTWPAEWKRTPDNRIHCPVKRCQTRFDNEVSRKDLHSHMAGNPGHPNQHAAATAFLEQTECPREDFDAETIDCQNALFAQMAENIIQDPLQCQDS